MKENTYLIRVVYDWYGDERPNDLLYIAVPEDVKFEYIISEMKTIRDLFFALKEIDNYTYDIEKSENYIPFQETDRCIDDYVLPENAPRCKEMVRQIFSSEDEVNNIFANDGENGHTLISYLYSIHEDWHSGTDIISTDFIFNE